MWITSNLNAFFYETNEITKLLIMTIISVTVIIIT